MLVLDLLAGITAVLIVYYRFLKFSRINNEIEEYKEKNSRRWEKIDKSKFRELPAIIIRWYLSLKDPFKIIYEKLRARGRNGKLPRSFHYIYAVLVVVCFGLYYTSEGRFAPFALLAIFVGSYFMIFKSNPEHYLSTYEATYSFVKYFIVFLISYLVTISFLTLGDDITWLEAGTTSIMDKDPIISGFIFSNVIFDVLTVYITYFILSKAINNLRFLFLFITFDLIMSTCFSIYSIYFALLWTDQSISLLEATHMLIGLSPNGSVWQFGSYFWAMHTTFIPTLIYLSVLVLVIIAKYKTIPAANFFYRASATEDPYHMYSFFYATLSAIFLLISFIVGHYLKSPS